VDDIFPGNFWSFRKEALRKAEGKKKKTEFFRLIQIVVALLTNLLFITKL